MTIDDFCKWWSVGGSPTPHTNLLCLVSFGATGFRLAYGTQNAIRLGKKMLAEYNDDVNVLFGEFTGNPVEGLEKRLKMECIPWAIFAGQVISTIEEAKRWKSSLPKSFRPTKGMLIVTDEMHSRSARRVSNRVWNGWWLKRLVNHFRGTNIPVRIVTFPTKDAIDPWNPMKALRNQRLWVRNNILRELFLMFVPFGYTIMSKLNVHQPIVRS